MNVARTDYWADNTLGNQLSSIRGINPVLVRVITSHSNKNVDIKFSVHDTFLE